MDEDAVAGQRLATALMAPLYAGWGAQIVLAGSFFGLFMGISTRTWASFSSVVRGVLLAVSSLLLVQTAFSYSEIVWFGGKSSCGFLLGGKWAGGGRRIDELHLTEI